MKYKEKRRTSRKRQLSLLSEPRPNTKAWWIHNQNVYGGRMNYRKVRRPFDPKKLVHAVFKANELPARTFNFNGHARTVRGIITRAAARYGVQIKDVAIHRDHIHLLVWTKYRQSLSRMLRLVAADCGRYYMRLLRLNGVRSPKALWKYRPFTRLVSWGKRSLANVLNYFRRNRLEVMNLVEYTPRNHRLDVFLLKFENST